MRQTGPLPRRSPTSWSGSHVASQLRYHGDLKTNGLSTLIKDHLAGGAARLAALLLPQILPVFSVVAPCHPGAALRDLVLVQRGQATSHAAAREEHP